MTPEPILAQVLFDAAPPPLDRERVQQRLSERFGRVAEASDDDPDPFMFAFADLPTGGDAAAIPTTLSFMSSPQLETSDPLLEAVEQTWDWPEAEEVPRSARGAWVVMPMVSWAWLDRRTRLALVHAGVEAVLEQAEPIALHWPTSQRLVSPGSYRRARLEATDELYPAANVRMFRIENGGEDEVLMDTLGLAPLGLPDLEIRYQTLDPGEVAAQLGNLAVYVFEHGDVIDDGDTVEGVPPGVAWRCQRSAAAVPPERIVIELASDG